MPNRLLAKLLVNVLQFGAVIYFFVEAALLILSLAGGRIDIGGAITTIVISAMVFSLGVLLDVALSIERRLFEITQRRQ